MTEAEEKLFQVFIDDDIYNKEITYEFVMKSGDEFIVEYDGEGESEINPLTGDDDQYYGFVFHVITVKKDCSGNYCDDSLVEVSKYNFPIKIVKLSVSS